MGPGKVIIIYFGRVKLFMSPGKVIKIYFGRGYLPLPMRNCHEVKQQPNKKEKLIKYFGPCRFNPITSNAPFLTFFFHAYFRLD